MENRFKFVVVYEIIILMLVKKIASATNTQTQTQSASLWLDACKPAARTHTHSADAYTGYIQASAKRRRGAHMHILGHSGHDDNIWRERHHTAPVACGERTTTTARTTATALADSRVQGDATKKWLKVLEDGKLRPSHTHQTQE